MNVYKRFSEHNRQDEYIHTRVANGIIASCSIIHGTGLFATRAFVSGEQMMKFGGFLFSRAEVKAGLAHPESLTGYADEWYLGRPLSYPGAIDDFLNHSCDPNLWLKDEVTVVARHDIDAGEEITIDYATFEIDDSWRMPSPCHCGTEICREKVTGSDWRNEALQIRYADHFLPCIEARRVNDVGSCAAI